MSDIEALLSRISRRKEEAKETLRPPADLGEAAKMDHYANDVLKTPLPKSYILFLSKMDGLNFNGYLIFGASTRQTPYLPSFAEANELLARTPRQHALYGHTGDEMYAQHLASSRWQALDRASLSVLEEFESFDLMLSHVLQEALD